MAHIVRAQVTIPYVNFIPELAVTNTFHFNAASNPVTDIVELPASEAIVAALVDFYSADGSIGDSIVDHYHSDWAPQFAQIKLYDLTDPMPRSPLYDAGEVDLGIPSQSGTDLPPELAVCLSYKSSMPSGSIRARRQGRVFLGPWSTAALAATAGGMISDTVIDIIGDAAVRLRDDPDTTWCVYSPTTNPVVVSGETGFGVLGGWVDNEWDHLERREYSSGSKTLWS
jgi:hypothetical protein